jgi:hypothetical protein
VAELYEERLVGNINTKLIIPRPTFKQETPSPKVFSLDSDGLPDYPLPYIDSYLSYRKNFVGKGIYFKIITDHGIFVGVLEKYGPVIISIVLDSSTTLQNTFKIILRSKDVFKS